jgi:hypothetical protein
MKTNLTAFFVCIVWGVVVNGQSAKDYAVTIQATISSNPPSVQLHWPADTLGNGYHVFRKQLSASSWGSERASLAASATSFTDTNVNIGNAYEYYIQRSNTDPDKTAHGYIYTGIYHKADYHRGLLCILIDQNYAIPLATEINEMVLDFIRDGWAIQKVYVQPSKSVAEVKLLIQTIRDQAQSVSPLRSVFILGHVAVPYSGGFVASEGEIYPPDGHEDHEGAWPADVYYGSMDESIWTDTSVNNTTPVRIQNQNIPGDGKFDLMYLQDHKVSFEIGRVDLTHLPAFGLSDTILTQRYLHKLHAYKTAQSPVHRAGLIDDNFGVVEGEAFASATWNDFTTFFGDSISVQDYVLATREKPYLFSYGCGFGNYSTCFGVVNSSQFANDSIQQYFTLLFGSYFGDWDSDNNLLRSALASKKGGLASAWSGRPYWRLHPMALGKSIGYCTKLTQQNFLTNGTQPSGYAYSSYPTFIHVGLMGDPTLRLSMPQPVEQVTATSASDSISITINWTPVPNVIGYHIGITPSFEYDFPASIEVPATQTSWTHAHPFLGNNIYLVRPIYLEYTPSGSYYNMGLGAIDSAYSNNMVGIKEQQSPLAFEVTVSPNPTERFVSLRFETAPSVDIELTDIYGKTMHQFQAIHSGQSLDLSSFTKGYYFLRVTHGTSSTVKKIILQ